MNGELMATLQASRLEFRALMDRPARLADPAELQAELQAVVLAEAFPTIAPCGCAEGACDCAPDESAAAEVEQPAQLLPASWTEASAAAQAAQLQSWGVPPSKRRRTIAARRQPLAPVAPITAQDGF